jgi:mono/diheme cytochrome c family protein
MKIPATFCFALATVLFLLNAPLALAQTATFNEDVAHILYENCTSCHRTGGIAPFALEDYQDAFSNKGSIAWSVSNGTMPPWPADTTYQDYVGERILTQNEIATIVDWVADGAPEGNPANAPIPPVFSDESILGTPDLQLRMPSFTSSAEIVDDYICFVIPSGLTQDRVIRAVEVIPGNREIVHHALVFIEEGTLQAGPIFNCGSPPAGKLLTGYTPGASPTVFPDPPTTDPMGFRMDAGSNLILAMHYPQGSNGMKDSTAVNLFFYPPGTTDFREVLAEPVISDWSFCLQPNQVQSLYGSIGGFNIPVDITVLSVFPHMHLLGKNWDVYATTAVAPVDTLPFVRINQWDFAWQGFYFFKNPVKLPAFSTIHAHAQYDNTTSNKDNPFDPPKQVCAGLNTNDEMFLVYAHFLAYEPGDELITQGATVSVEPEVPSPLMDLQVAPNPFWEELTLEFSLSEPGRLQLSFFNLQGQMVMNEDLGMRGSGPQRVRQELPPSLPEGIYFFRFLINGQTITGKLVKGH